MCARYRRECNFIVTYGLAKYNPPLVSPLRGFAIAIITPSCLAAIAIAFLSQSGWTRFSVRPSVRVLIRAFIVGAINAEIYRRDCVAIVALRLFACSFPKACAHPFSPDFFVSLSRKLLEICEYILYSPNEWNASFSSEIFTLEIALVWIHGEKCPEYDTVSSGVTLEPASRKPERANSAARTRRDSSRKRFDIIEFVSSGMFRYAYRSVWWLPDCVAISSRNDERSLSMSHEESSSLCQPRDRLSRAVPACAKAPSKHPVDHVIGTIQMFIYFSHIIVHLSRIYGSTNKFCH